ncbi:DinB family protein [Ornithinimicrobium humiphilum]
MHRMTAELTALLAHLAEARGHVLAAVDGLDEDDLTRPVAPSGWSIAQLLHHLTYDDEIFWGCAILGGDEEAAAEIQDGWRLPVTTGAEAVEGYRRWVSRTDALLAEVDLDAPARWWPPQDVFPFPPFADARACLLRLLVETTTHAGHLDLAREGIDGHQHLVVP